MPQWIDATESLGLSLGLWPEVSYKFGGTGMAARIGLGHPYVSLSRLSRLCSLLGVRGELRQFLLDTHAQHGGVYFSYEREGAIRKVYAMSVPTISALHFTGASFDEVTYVSRSGFRPEEYVDRLTCAHLRNLTGTKYYLRLDKGVPSAVHVFAMKRGRDSSFMSASHAAVGVYSWLGRPPSETERGWERGARDVLWIGFANSSSGRTANLYFHRPTLPTS